MIIRKKFKVESAHIVRNCTSHRCSHSIHGHSAVIEVFFEAKYLDNAQMVMDFGLMNTIKSFIDSMDHCYLLCSKDAPEFRATIHDLCHRYIDLPFNPSAEMLSMYVFAGIQRILKYTNFSNGERDVAVAAVRYHETETGYAECDEGDVERLFRGKLNDVHYSDGVKNEWCESLKRIYNGNPVTNPIIPQQITL